MEVKQLDEIKEAPKDEVSTPEEPKETTPEKEPETLAEQVAHIKEAALAEVGRNRVETEKAVRAAKAAEDRFIKFIKEQEEAEEERYQDDMPKLTEIRKRREERENQAKLDQREQGLSEREEKANKADRERNVNEVSTRLKVDPKLLAKLVKDTDGSTEAIEAEAQDLPKQGEPKDPLILDTGKTKGGGASFEKIRDDMISNPSNDKKMQRYIDAKKAKE